jgi:hypothetical protein
MRVCYLPNPEFGFKFVPPCPDRYPTVSIPGPDLQPDCTYCPTWANTQLRDGRQWAGYPLINFLCHPARATRAPPTHPAISYRHASVAG